MENIFFIYDKMNLANIPPNCIIKMKKNDLYYKSDKSKSNIKSFNDISKYKFMKYSLDVKDRTESGCNCNIYIKFNISEFKKQMEFGLDNRKLFYEVMNKCYWKLFYDYISNILQKPGIVKTNLLDWIAKRELNKDYYYTPGKGMLSLGKTYLNFNKGKVMNIKKVKFDKILFSGGIIYNNNRHHIIETFFKRTEKELIKDKSNDLSCSATLIISSKLKIMEWKHFLDSKKQNSILITKTKDYTSLSLEKYRKAKWVIVDLDFLKKKQYKKHWEQYQIGEMTIEETMESAAYEFFTISNREKKVIPSLSVIKWRRIILDTIMDKIEINKYLSHHCQSFTADHKWIINNYSFEDKNELLSFYKWIGSNKVQYPLHNVRGNVKNITNLVHSNISMDEGKEVHDMIKTMKIKLNGTENDIHKFISNKLNNNDILTPYLTFTSAIHNYGFSVKELSSKDKKQLKNECSVCGDKIKESEAIRLRCEHWFCSSCIFENMKVTNPHRCPLCRKICNLESIGGHPSHENNKINNLINLVKGKHYVIIYARLKEVILHVKQLFEELLSEYSTVYLETVREVLKVKRDQVVFVDHSNIHLLRYLNKKPKKELILFDIVPSFRELGREFLDLKKVSITQLFYENTIEESVLKKKMIIK